VVSIGDPGQLALEPGRDPAPSCGVFVEGSLGVQENGSVGLRGRFGHLGLELAPLTNRGGPGQPYARFAASFEDSSASHSRAS